MKHLTLVLLVMPRLKPLLTLSLLRQVSLAELRVYLALDDGLATRQRAFFDLNLSDGTYGSIFTPDSGLTVDAFGVIPHGNGWYRIYHSNIWIWFCRTSTEGICQRH